MRVVGLLICQVSALFFEMSEKETKCFIEELPEETMVVGKYKTELLDAKSNTKSKTKPGLGMHVEVKDPNNKVIQNPNSRTIVRLLKSRTVAAYKATNSE